MLKPLKEWAGENKVRYAHARRLAASGLLPIVRLGRRLYVDSEVIAEFAKSGGAGLPGGWRRAAKAAATSGVGALR